MLDAIVADIAVLRGEIVQALAAPSVERLRAGVRVVIGGPPNAGKSTLLNLLAERDAAIVSPISGTTRDRIEAPVERAGLPIVLVDTAGLVGTIDPVEAIGVARARQAIAAADLLLWLGDDVPPREGAIWVHARADQPGRIVMPAGPEIAIAADDPASIEKLWRLIALRAGSLVATSDDVPAMHEHQRRSCQACIEALGTVSADPLLTAEALAQGRRELARLLGLDATEAMLDALFGRFCLGK